MPLIQKIRKHRLVPLFYHDDITVCKKVLDTVNKVTVKDCGCDKRKDTLNRLIPYNYNK